MRISFVVPGDPIAYLRMTQAQVRLMRIPDHKMRPAGMAIKRRIRAYLDYKDMVAVCSAGRKIDREPLKKVYMNVMIYFRNRRHGDPENIRKGIQDAVYHQDKMVAGNVDFDYDPGNPRCEVEIIQE